MIKSEGQFLRKSLGEFELLNRKINAVVFNAGNTDAHELAKARLCLMLSRMGKNYLCEQQLKYGAGRPDVCVADDGVIIEVLESETEKQFEEKKKKYPKWMAVIPAYASHINSGNWNYYIGGIGNG